MNGSRLKAARRALGLTQAQLSARLGIDQGFLSRLESGGKRPSLDVLDALAKELGVSAAYLLGEEVELGQEATLPDSAEAVLQDYLTAAGLRALASDHTLVQSLKISPPEWRALASILLPASVNKDGYLSLLFAVRAITNPGKGSRI